MIDNLRVSGEWKTHLTLKICFIISKISGKCQSIHSKSDKTEIIICNNTNKIINKLFSSILRRYHMVSKTLMEGCNFVFNGVVEMYYKCHRISLNRVRSYIDSPDWMKKSNNKLDCMFLSYHVRVSE